VIRVGCGLAQGRRSCVTPDHWRLDCTRQVPCHQEAYAQHAGPQIRTKDWRSPDLGTAENIVFGTLIELTSIIRVVEACGVELYLSPVIVFLQHADELFQCVEIQQCVDRSSDGKGCIFNEGHDRLVGRESEMKLHTIRKDVSLRIDKLIFPDSRLTSEGSVLG
jgi:hypothetical protein